MTSKKNEDEISQYYSTVEGYARVMQSRLNGLSCEMNDLRSWGVAGLLSAFQDFDPEHKKNATLRTYASRRILWSISDGLRLWRRSSIESGDAISTEDMPPGFCEPAAGPMQERALLMKRVLEAVGSLPKDLQELVKQHFFEGHAVGEISRARNCSHQYTAQRLQSAIFHLQLALRDSGDKMTFGGIQAVREEIPKSISRRPRCPACGKAIERGHACLTLNISGSLKKFHPLCLQKLGNALSAFAQGHQPGDS